MDGGADDALGGGGVGAVGGDAEGVEDEVGQRQRQQRFTARRQGTVAQTLRLWGKLN